MKHEYSPSVEQIAVWMKQHGWGEITLKLKNQTQFANGERRITILHNPMPTEYRVLLGRLAHLHRRQVEELRVEISEVKIIKDPFTQPEIQLAKPQRVQPQSISSSEEYKPSPIKTFPYWKRR
jgi:hypothetical protein